MMTTRAIELDWWRLLGDKPEWLASVAFAGCPLSAKTWQAHVEALTEERLGATLADTISAALTIIDVALESDSGGPVACELDLFASWVAEGRWRKDDIQRQSEEDEK